MFKSFSRHLTLGLEDLEPPARRLRFLSSKNGMDACEAQRQVEALELAKREIAHIAAWADRIEASKAAATVAAPPPRRPRRPTGTLHVALRGFGGGLRVADGGARRIAMEPFATVAVGAEVRSAELPASSSEPESCQGVFEFEVDFERAADRIVRFEVRDEGPDGSRKCLGRATVDAEALAAGETRALRLALADAAATGRGHLGREAAYLDVALLFEVATIPEVLILAEGDALAARTHRPASATAAAAPVTQGAGDASPSSPRSRFASEASVRWPSEATDVTLEQESPQPLTEEELRWRYLEKQLPDLVGMRAAHRRRRRIREEQEALAKRISEEHFEIARRGRAQAPQYRTRTMRKRVDIEVLRRVWKRIRARTKNSASAKQLFRKYDRGSGCGLDFDAFRNLVRGGLLLTREHVPEDHLYAILVALDVDCSGTISMDEWLGFLEHGTAACEDAVVTADELRARELLEARFGSFLLAEDARTWALAEASAKQAAASAALSAAAHLAADAATP